MGVVNAILWIFKVDIIFLLTFFFLGSIILSAALCDCFPPAIPGNNGWYLPLVEFWIWLAGVIPMTFFLLFITFMQSYEGKIDKTRVKFYLILLIGIVLLFSPLENIGLYLYRGFEYYNPQGSCYQTYWINELFPLYYVIAIPGIILIIIAFRWSVKNNNR